MIANTTQISGMQYEEWYAGLTAEESAHFDKRGTVKRCKK